MFETLPTIVTFPYIGGIFGFRIKKMRFSVFVSSDRGSDFYVHCIFFFSGFVKEVTPHSRAKTVIPRVYL